MVKRKWKTKATEPI